MKVNAVIARLKGEGGSAAPAPTPAPTAAPASAPDAEAKPAAAPAPAPQKAAALQSSRGPRIFASPLARRIAEQNGVDLASIQGSGPHGRIIKRDVEGKAGGAPVAKRASSPAAPAAAARGEPRQVLSLEQMGIKPGSYDLVPLDGMRKVIAKRLTDSFRDVPHFPLTMDLEIDRLLQARSAINAHLEGQGIKVSVNDIIIKASAMALKAVPEANASFTPEGIAMHHHADVAMAVAIDGGLITPIIFAAETKSLARSPWRPRTSPPGRGTAS